MIVVQKGVAHPWMCDVIGHMTTRHYVAMFDDAAYHLLYNVFGWAGASDPDGKIGWSDARHIIEYKAEVLAGDVLVVRSGLTKVGTKSITIFYEMANLEKNEIAATLECVCVLIDLQARKSIELSDKLRELASQHLIETAEKE
ncbi:MAG: acyl-CoA thioesterase [Proteobacteria bacterium]|nr:acyl-CoA thioesterase [Pseudomonadota bacterium]